MTQQTDAMTEGELAEKKQCLSCKSTGGMARPVEITMAGEPATIRLCLPCRTRLVAGEFYKLGGV